ncbi:hypothetical protein [Pasteurella sp. PK-2025]|uniref:hypothetical protein n=1 Tax=unclassified Pasteurella TaxID=2621516 RepID=UPI003C71B9A9
MSFSEKIGYKVGSAIAKFKNWKAPIFVKIISIFAVLIILFFTFFDYRNEGMYRGIYISDLGTYIIWGLVLFIIFKFREQIAEFFESPEAYHLRHLRKEVHDLRNELKEKKAKNKIIKDICSGVYDKHKY